VPLKIQLHSGTAAEWAAENPVLLAGEPGIETDTRRIKFGTGALWNATPYTMSPRSIGFNTGALTNTDQPAAERALANSTRFILRADLTGYSDVRLGVRVTAAGAAGAIVTLKYMITFSTTVGDWLQIGSAAQVTASLAATGWATSGWVSLAAGAKADVHLVVSEQGGDAVADPAVGPVTAEFR
jgi:major tropism determinant Mtd-like protein